MVIGRQRAVLAGDACDPNPVACPMSVEMRAGITARPGKEDTQVLGLFSYQEQVSAGVVVIVIHDAFGSDENADIAKRSQIGRPYDLRRRRGCMAEFSNIARQKDRPSSPADDHSLYFYPIARLHGLKLADISLQ